MLVDVDLGSPSIQGGIDFRHWFDPRSDSDVEQLASIVAAGTTRAIRNVAP